MSKEQQITEAIQWLKSTGEQVVDFTTEQAPLYCQELLNWTFYGSLFWGVLLFLISLSAFFVIKPTKKGWNDEYGSFDKNCGVAVMGTVWIIVCIVIFFTSIVNFSDAVKCKIAPRVILIEHFKK